MDIKIHLPDDFFTSEEISDLKLIFNSEDEDNFTSNIQKIGKAALAEYIQMFLGKDLPSRADEIRVHRLFLLIQHFYENRIPTEAEVSQIFQLPDTRSKTLIQNTISRFHLLLKDTIENTLRSVITRAVKSKVNRNYEVEIQSKFVVDELNRLIQRKASSQTKIVQKVGSSGYYIIDGDTMDSLRSIFKIK